MRKHTHTQFNKNLGFQYYYYANEELTLKFKWQLAYKTLTSVVSGSTNFFFFLHNFVNYTRGKKTKKNSKSKFATKKKKDFNKMIHNVPNKTLTCRLRSSKYNGYYGTH